MSPSFSKTAVLAFAFTGAASATLQYTLAAADDYTGTSFWDGFNFITTPDPTFGFVEYQSRAVAESSTFGGPLIKTFSNGSNYMGVDYWNTYSTSATGRPSVRIETTKQYQYGLFVADLAHMPASVCGTWPAFWTVNHVNYPSNGEIDILENINENTQSLETLHTTAGCSVVGNMLGKQQNATQVSYNCDDQATSSNYGSQSTYQGCSATNSDPNSYGSTFNANSGGVYAMEWTSEVIQIWNFGPNNIPSNLKNGNPDTSTWGLPQFTTAQGSCDIDAHFQEQQVVFNTDFCGSYAGLDYFWEQTSCYKSNPTKYATCVDYVAANPAMYEDAFWTINSLKVYQKTNVVSSSSSSTHSSTTTSTSSSTSKTSTTTTSKTSTTTSKISTTSTTATTSTTSSSTTTSSTSKSSTSSSTSTSSKSSTSSPSSSKTSTSSSSSQGTSTTSKPSSSSTATTSQSASTSSTSSSVVTGPTSSSSSSVTPSTSPVSTQTTSSTSSPSSSAPSSSSTSEVQSSSSSSVSTSSSSGVSTSASSSSVPYSNTTTTTGPSGTSSVLYTTSTVLSTRTYTITSCAPTVTNCPAKLGQVTTDVVTLYTTVCPVTATETSSGIVSTKSPYSPPPPPESVTSTVFTTKVYTITSCAPTVTNCPAKLGQVTTEVVSLYTTVCPYTPKGSHPAYPIIPSSILASSPVASAGGVLSSPASSPTVVIVKTETVKPVSSIPVFSTISKLSNSTISTSTLGVPIVKTSSAGGVVAPSESPIYTTSGASEMKVKGAFAVVLGALVMLI